MHHMYFALTWLSDALARKHKFGIQTFLWWEYMHASYIMGLRRLKNMQAQPYFIQNFQLQLEKQVIF